MKTLFFAGFAWMAQAATIGPPTCLPLQVTPPQIITCTLPYAGGAASLQGNVTTSQATGPITVTVAGAAVAAAKSVSVSGNSVLWYGMNQAVIADGQVATITIPSAGIVAGTLNIGFANTFAVDPTGTTIATTPTSTVAVSILGANVPFTITTSSLPNGTVGAAYSSQLLASASATWSGTPCVGGLAVSASGLVSGNPTLVSGNPTLASTCSFTVQAVNSSGTVATRALSITIAPVAVSACDVNKDGKVDAKDVVRAVNNLQSGRPIFTAAPTLNDLQLVINAEVGKPCVTSPPSPVTVTAALTSLACTNPMLSAAGSTSGCTVTLSAAAPVGSAAVTVSSGGCDPISPGSSTLTIAAGSVSGQAQFTVTTGFGARPCTFTAMYGGALQSATVTVGP